MAIVLDTEITVNVVSETLPFTDEDRIVLSSHISDPTKIYEGILWGADIEVGAGPLDPDTDEPTDVFHVTGTAPVVTFVSLAEDIAVLREVHELFRNNIGRCYVHPGGVKRQLAEDPQGRRVARRLHDPEVFLSQQTIATGLWPILLGDVLTYDLPWRPNRNSAYWALPFVFRDDFKQNDPRPVVVQSNATLSSTSATLPLAMFSVGCVGDSQEGLSSILDNNDRLDRMVAGLGVPDLVLDSTPFQDINLNDLIDNVGENTAYGYMPGLQDETGYAGIRKDPTTRYPAEQSYFVTDPGRRDSDGERQNRCTRPVSVGLNSVFNFGTVGLPQHTGTYVLNVHKYFGAVRSADGLTDLRPATETVDGVLTYDREISAGNLFVFDNRRWTIEEATRKGQNEWALRVRNL